MADQQTIVTVSEASRGPRGLSAYQVALNNGFVGTEAEWLASLEGPPGEPGAPGVGSGDKGDPGGNVMAVGLFNDLPTLNIPLGTDIVQTSGFNTKGRGFAQYVADELVDAAYVALYPKAAVVTANGRGFRLAVQHGVNPDSFGAVRGDTTLGLNAATNNDAIAAMLAYLYTLSVSPASLERHLPPIYLGFDTLEISQTIAPQGCVDIIGYGAGNWNAAVPRAGSCIKAYGCTAFYFGEKALNCILRDVLIQGDFTVALGEAEFHGVHFTGRIYLEGVKVHSMRGDAFHGDGSVGPGYTIDNSVLINCDGRDNRAGTYFTGGDANVITVIGGVWNTNRWTAHYDDCMLGNTYLATESNSNGKVSFNNGTAGRPSSIVTYNNGGGNKRYGVIRGQEAWASVNPPTGTTDDNQGWYYEMDGGTGTGVVAWFSGMSLRAGGPAITTSPVGKTQFINCYAELGQGLAQTTYPTQVKGGVLSDFVWKGSSGLVETLPGTTLNPKLGLSPSIGVTSRDDTTSKNTVTTTIGEKSSQRCHIRFSGPGYDTFGRAIKALDDTTGDIVLDRAHTIPYAWRITGPNTTQMFGTGVVQPDAMSFYKFIMPPLGWNNNTDDGRRFAISDTVPPAAGDRARGEMVFARSPVVGGAYAAQCYASGNPGSWRLLYSGYGAAPIGYAPGLGAGNVATQLTSKSTAVGMNKITGRITMAATALAAGAKVSFTFNNTLLGADDALIMRVRGGYATPGSYRVWSEGEAVGSRTIWVENISGGSLSEAVVLGFVTIKGAID